MDIGEVKLVVFGQGGDTVYCTSGKIQGYGTPEKPHASVDIPDGTPALDIREAVETKEGFSWVFKGPLVNVNLADGEEEKAPRSPLMEDALSKSNAPHSAVGLTLSVQKIADKKGTRGPLDSVSVSEYIRGWRNHGARVGYYVSNQIKWEGE